MRINTTGYKNIREIHGLESYENDPEGAMLDLCMILYGNGDNIHNTMPYTTMLFSGVSRERYTQDFKRLIEKEGLGDVVQTLCKRNPNSGNGIKAYIWTLNKETLLRWYLNNK